MIRLSGDAEKLQIFLGGAVATSEPAVVVCFNDAPTGNDGQFGDYVKVKRTSGASTVDICDAPARAVLREIDFVSIRNGDTATVTATIQLLSGSTARQLVTVALAAGDQLFYSHVHGWQVLNSAGQLRLGAPLVIDGNIGLGTTPAAWESTARVLQAETISVGYFLGIGLLGQNTYWDGANWRAIETGTAAVNVIGGGFAWYTMASVAAGAAQTLDLWLSLQGDGRLYGRGLHNNASSVAGSSNQYIASGTFNTVPAGVANVDAATNNGGQWLRVGNVFVYGGSISVDPTAAAVTVVNITLPPVVNANFASFFQVAGSGVFRQAAANIPVAIYANAAQTAQLVFYPTVTTNCPIDFVLVGLIL